MATKPMKNCSTLLVIRNMSMKIKIPLHSYQEWLKLKDLPPPGVVIAASGLFIHLLETLENSTTTLEMVWQFLIKLKIYVLSDTAIPFLGIYLREMKIQVHQKI